MLPILYARRRRRRFANLAGVSNRLGQARIYEGVTDILWKILRKPPEATFVVFEEVDLENWGRGGLPVAEYRKSLSAPASD
uniref:tautomerase family protein n=1 Tax=Sphingomonas sp. AR_OL41 TaxID=3042729 RepID=UPI0032AEE63F